MLARSFLPSADLEIPDLEKETLIRVLHMLERGELVDVQRYDPINVPNGFCMSVVGGERDCGTVACIMGWCQIVSNDRCMFMKLTHDRPCTLQLYELFMYADERRHKVTGEQAARALSNYLTTGHASWDQVLAYAEHVSKS